MVIRVSYPKWGPRGSVLWPLLFLVAMNDLSFTVHAKYISYADYSIIFINRFQELL